MSTTSSLNVIAKIPQSAICSISNFLLSDKKLEERNCSKSLEKDCEKPVDFTNGFETSDDSDTSQQVQQTKWLRHTLIVARPNLSIVVIASAQRFVILENSESKTMEISTRVDATKEDFVYISALNAFGISSLNSSRSSEDDWTCICVVFFLFFFVNFWGTPPHFLLFSFLLFSFKLVKDK
ncbi:unnamed protein product [Meloidogyne enterolobii]|uniref:Uncharacterized protein n=1 Tax=Meloidogyne enterolobii TaxID=390850 RepID=A0ACB1AVA7_MELEN